MILRIAIHNSFGSYNQKFGRKHQIFDKLYENIIMIHVSSKYPSQSGSNPTSIERQWWIPLTFATESRLDLFNVTSPFAWLQPKVGKLTIEDLNSKEWVIFNVQEVGYYRVNYDVTNWNLLTKHLRSGEYKTIPALNRAQILDDAFNLARGGYVDYSIPLNLSKYLILEKDYEPWIAAINSIQFLDKILRDRPDVHSVFRVSLSSMSHFWELHS